MNIKVINENILERITTIRFKIEVKNGVILEVEKWWGYDEVDWEILNKEIYDTLTEEERDEIYDFLLELDTN